MPSRKPSAPNELLTPEFQARLRLLKDLFFRRQALGELRGGGFGPTPEFDAHRSYEPGDDLRYIDWNLYARMEKLLLKIFTVEDESRVCVLLDASASMRLGPGRKSLMAARFAAAFSYLTLCTGRPLQIGAFAHTHLGSRRLFRSLAQFPQCASFFGNPPQGEATRFGASMAELLAAEHGRLFLIVVSDFLQEEDIGREIAWLRRGKHDLHLVQVLDDADLEPPLLGSCTVTDAEGPGAITLFAGQDFRDRLHRAIREYLETLARTCRRFSIPLLQVRASRHFEQAFVEHLASGLKR